MNSVFFFAADDDPTSDNIELSCSSVINKDTISYDIIIKIHLDSTFTPAVISAIDNLQVSSLESDENGVPIPRTLSVRRISVGPNITQGPVTIDIVLNNFPQLPDDHGYRVIVSAKLTMSCIPTSKF